MHYTACHLPCKPVTQKKRDLVPCKVTLHGDFRSVSRSRTREILQAFFPLSDNFPICAKFSGPDSALTES